MGRELRPHALWGFYGFPYCNYNAGQNGEYECSKPYRDWNDRMMFIFNESSALYPSIYLGFNATSDQRFRYVQAILREARRVANKFTPPLPIYAYSKIEYNPLKEIADFYDTRDLCSTIKQPADLGIDGIIFWSSSNNMTLRCPYIKDNMEKVIGPKVRTIISQQDACGKIRCRSNGKCVLPTNTTCQDFNMNTNLYKCECNEGFSGEDCSVQNTDGVAVAPQRSGRSATLKRVIHLS
ncbi:hypothetical protein Y032_0637g946 [Ancylostoma ceylanicum]|nr:hypothetical protein Y032_0637g946 [Ancylostoma ceylanicum]